MKVIVKSSGINTFKISLPNGLLFNSITASLVHKQFTKMADTHPDCDELCEIDVDEEKLEHELTESLTDNNSDMPVQNRKSIISSFRKIRKIAKQYKGMPIVEFNSSDGGCVWICI